MRGGGEAVLVAKSLRFSFSDDVVVVGLFEEEDEKKKEKGEREIGRSKGGTGQQAVGVGAGGEK